MTAIKQNHDVKRSILYSLIKFSFRINLLRSFQFNEELENSSIYFFLLYFCLHFSCLFVKCKEIWKATVYILQRTPPPPQKKKNLNRPSSLFNEHLRIFLVKYYFFTCQFLLYCCSCWQLSENLSEHADMHMNIPVW